MNILAIPAYLVFTSIFIVSIVVSIGVHWLIKKYRFNQVLLDNNEFTSITYPIVALVYGVLLAFTIVIIWGQYLDAEKSVTSEVTYLSELWRDGQTFPQKERRILQQRLSRYVSSVIERMQENRKNVELLTKSNSTAEYEDIWQFYYHYQPESETQKTFYSQSLAQLNELGRQRRLRIMYSNAEIHPTLWLFLLGGGVVTISFAFMVGTRSGQFKIIVSSLLTGLILSSIYLVYSFQHPFVGDVSIKPTPYIMLKKSFNLRVDNSK